VVVIESFTTFLCFNIIFVKHIPSLWYKYYTWMGTQCQVKNQGGDQCQ
jgi:hypothetical protein